MVFRRLAGPPGSNSAVGYRSSLSREPATLPHLENPLIFLLDVDSVPLVSPFTTTTHHFSTESFGTGSGDAPPDIQFTPALGDNRFGTVATGLSTSGVDNISVDTTLGGELQRVQSSPNLRTTGPSRPKDVTIKIAHAVAGQPRVDGIDPETNNLMGQAAFLRGVGTGGDGTVYTFDDPFTVAKGTVVAHTRHGNEFDEITVRPSSSIHRVTLPGQVLAGYPSGLRFNGSTDYAEITGFTDVPKAFTLMCGALVPRAWDVGSGTQTFASQRSVSFYFSQATGLGRQLHLSYAHSGGTATLDGPEFDADERVHFFTVVVDTEHASSTGVEATFYIDQGPGTTVENTTDAFVYTSEAWRLGRFRTTTTQTADTILGAWALFDTELPARTVRSYTTQRLTGVEDHLTWWFPGDAVSSTLLDYASANAAAPLDAAITGATEAPLFLGTPDLAGTLLPAVYGSQKNVPLTAIDPARKIYRVAGDDVAAVTAVVDRQVPYEIEAEYDSPLDFADNPPTSSGNCTVCPYMGGLVRMHTEVDGVENSADVLGHSFWGNALVLGNDLTDAHVSWGMTDLDPVYISGEWAVETWVALRKKDADTTADVLAICDFWRMTATPIQGDGEQIRYTVTVTKSDFSTLSLSYDSCVNTTIPFRIEAKNDGSGGSLARLLVAGKVVDTASDGSTELLTAASAFFTPELGRSTSGDGPDLASYLPVRLWSAAGSSDADAESKHQEYLFENPSPSASDLEGLWYRYSSSPTTLDDETANGYDGTISSTALWCPGHATDRLSVVNTILSHPSLTTTTTFDSSAFSFNPSSIAVHVRDRRPIGDVAADILSGGNLYMLHGPDETVTIGYVRDPATATPDATHWCELVKVEDIDLLFQPSSTVAYYGNNPLVQTSVLAGAEANRRAFAEKPDRVVEVEVGDNRTIYGDEEPPLGRALPINTMFVDRLPAQSVAKVIADMWDTVRPQRTVYLIGSDGDRDNGFTSVRPGQILTLRHERFSGGSITVLVLRVVKNSTYDQFVVR